MYSILRNANKGQCVPESGLCFLEGPGGRGRGMGATVGPSAWVVEGALGLLLTLQSVPSKARSCEGTKQPQAESRTLFSDFAWLFQPRDRTSTSGLHRLGWQRDGLRHGQEEVSPAMASGMKLEPKGCPIFSSECLPPF